MQTQRDGSERPISFRSCALSARQWNYQTREREILSAVEAFDDWRVYLSGRQFIWRTDHDAIKWARTLWYKSRKIQRWLAEIADLDVVPQLRPGDQLPASDALSRLTNPKVNAVTSQLTIKQLKEEQEKDPLISYARKCLRSGNRGEVRPDDLDKSNLWKHKDRFFFGAGGELYITTVDPAAPRAGTATSI